MILCWPSRSFTSVEMSAQDLPQLNGCEDRRNIVLDFSKAPNYERSERTMSPRRGLFSYRAKDDQLLTD